MKKIKRKLSQTEEFEIMRLVLDKFLWIGILSMTYGIYQWFNGTIGDGLIYIIFGAVISILFAIFLVREFEFIR